MHLSYHNPRDFADSLSKFVTILGFKLHYKDVGVGSNTFLRFIFFGAGIFSFKNVIKELAKHGRVIALDLPGFGLSERPLIFKDTIDPYGRVGEVAVIREFIAKLNLYNIILVVHSMWARVSALFEEKYAEHLLELVLEDPAINSYTAPKGFSNTMRGAVGKIKFPLIIKPIALLFESAISKAYFDKSKITKVMRKKYLQALRIENWDKGIYYLLITNNGVDIKSGLSNICIPTLVIAGAG